MEQNFNQTSFIPKESLAKDFRRQAPVVGLFSLVSILILVIAILFLGGSYAYARYLRNEIERDCGETPLTSTDGCGLRAKLERIKNSFQLELIADFQRKEAKIKAAEAVLASHNTIVPVFTEVLQVLTLPSISYSSLDYSEGDRQLKLSGVAKGYESIALQSDVFASSKEIENFLFSGFGLDLSGRVSFELVLKIKPGMSSYQTYIDNLAS